ncbi:ABC transporter permease [Dinghuibacter silviterrae]|uniref:Putative ABC transport system permease protein n=1 Tax=Dinghuibacter silviterrae TaxID=1539049 RepID=A0A4R8DG17_9BACT|nr:ABC transporter permease [Dinghuibacter silviterrae]TDW96561.1 putative ABC transport system permease protein [Dinghuibacter silviterrae]
MIKQFCKVALRNLGRQKALALINVLGLSVGLTCFIVFLLYAVNESGYDRFHKRAGDIYRVVEWAEGLPDREPGGYAGLSMAMGPALAQDLPEVERFVRFRTRGRVLVKVGDQVSRLSVSFADTPFFSMFSFPLVSGSPAHVLEGTHSIVLTQDMAARLFGRQDVTGRFLQVKIDTAFETFQVTGIAQNLPSNSIFNFGLLIGYPYALVHADARALTDWYETMGDETFVQLKPGSKLSVAQMVAFRERHLPDEERDLIQRKQWNGKGTPPITFRLQPLTDIHTNPHIDGTGDPVEPRQVWLLIAMAAGILLIACINFTTLSIGRSASRAKEIGVRKVIGSRRNHLVVQFLAEALVLTTVSALLALLLTALLLPLVSSLTGVALHLSFSRFPELWWMLTGLTVLTGLMAGAYPALVLSGFKPLDVFKSKVRLRGSNLFTRSLVVAQFVLSAGLLTGTFVILQQVSFMRNKDLGFHKENVIDIDASGVDDPRVYRTFRRRALGNAHVLGVTSAEIGLGEGSGFMGSGYSFRGKGGGSIEYPVAPGYIDVMGMTLLAGRDFDRNMSSDSTGAVVVNQALLQEFHIPLDSALDQVLEKADDNGRKIPYSIIGVVRDFNFVSLSQQVRPQLFFWPARLKVNHIYVRVTAGDPSIVLPFLARTWKTLVPSLAFRYNFQDEEMNRFYATETRWIQILGLAGGIAIGLACLGLFGLAALVSVNRHKEIGIRKVLGASVGSIVRLLSVEFSRLVLVALVIAAPLAWYFAHRWLEGYAYRIGIQWWVFLLTGGVTLGVALLTVGGHALRAALGNPVEGLREE